MSPASLIGLCSESDPDSRVLSGEELELMGQLRPYAVGNRKRSLGSAGVLAGGDDDVDEDVEDDGMDVN